MTLEQLANLGEFVGGVVVVISIVYVALQVRQNSHQLERTTQALRTTTSQYLTEDFNFWRQLIVQGDSTDTWIKGLQSAEGLSDAEQVRFNMIASSYLWTTWYFREINKSEELIDDLNNHMYADMFSHPGFREWYRTYAPSIGGEYREFLDQLLERSQELPDYKNGDLSNLLQGSIRAQ